VTMSPADFALVMEMEREIRSLGFQFDIFGKNTLVVTGLPMEATGKNEKELFEGLVEQFKQNQSGLNLPLRDNLACALAKRASIKTGQKLSREEMASIVEGLFSCHNPNYSPDGSTTFYIIETSKLESHFS
jgi:DNA mismatch repair protein MutL